MTGGDLETVRVLLVDDDEEDCLIIAGMLADVDRARRMTTRWW
jgi:hypothetical protein